MWPLDSAIADGPLELPPEILGAVTRRARIALALANHEAYRFADTEIGTHHMLNGLMREGSSAGARETIASGDFDVSFRTLRAVRVAIERLFPAVAQSEPHMVVLPFSADSLVAIRNAIRRASPHQATPQHLWETVATLADRSSNAWRVPSRLRGMFDRAFRSIIAGVAWALFGIGWSLDRLSTLVLRKP